MNKGAGYGVALLGLVVLIIGLFKDQISFLTALNTSIASGVGVVLIIVGVVLVKKSETEASSPHEVPIYEGKGKNRRIVGYQREGEK